MTETVNRPFEEFQLPDFVPPLRLVQGYRFIELNSFTQKAPFKVFGYFWLPTHINGFL